VPRHPERSKEIAELASKYDFGVVFRSAEQPVTDRSPIVICDKLGELRALYGLGSIALIGGTLVDHGGHNPLEPSAWGAALVAGPSQRNFSDIFDALEASGAMLRIEPNAGSLKQGLSGLLASRERTKAAGDAAKSYLDKNRGATLKNIELLQRLIGLD